MKPKIKIAFVCGWGQSSAELLERFSKQTPGGYGVWKDRYSMLFGVPDQKDADWTVILGDVPEEFPYRHIDSKHAIYVQRELPANGYTPPAWHSNAARILNYENGYCLGIWWVERSFQELLDLKPGPRPLKVGVITTAKMATEGQQLRIEFLRKFAKKAPDLLDVWGKDEHQLKSLFGSCYRGSLPYNGPNARNGDKSAGIEPYPLSFCFENCQQLNYFSEKLLDVLLLWSLPLYWGCPNLCPDFFPGGAFAWLPLGSPYFDVDEVIEWVRSDPAISLDAIAEARNRILWQHNLWPMLSRLIETGSVK